MALTHFHTLGENTRLKYVKKDCCMNPKASAPLFTHLLPERVNTTGVNGGIKNKERIGGGERCIAL